MRNILWLPTIIDRAKKHNFSLRKPQSMIICIRRNGILLPDDSCSMGFLLCRFSHVFREGETQLDDCIPLKIEWTTG
ncbi:MAG: hypothetical protein NTU90_07025 [Proteobacteria bacterium]|nr:hypothetical protein [Pseudomonadota bacterium]